jgi:NTE family protein
MKKSILSICSFALTVVIHAQKTPIKNLVFEGAGIRGVAYCGAIRELELKGILADIEKVGGTSAGAVTALCISLGYTADEIAGFLYSTNFKKLNDGRWFFAGGINRVNKYYGWYRGQRMIKWIEKMIRKKTGDEDISFEELYRRGFKDLYVTATQLNEQKLVVLSRKTYPHMRVKDAVRISVGIPFYYEAVLIDKDGKTYRSPKNKQDLDVMVDGGLIANFPIRIFDSVAVRPEGTQVYPDMATVGFRIDREQQIENDRSGKGLAPMPVHTIKEYASAFYNIVLESLNRQNLSPDDWKRTVSISDGNIAPRIRRLSKEEIDMLLENGRVATQRFLK